MRNSCACWSRLWWALGSLTVVNLEHVRIFGSLVEFVMLLWQWVITDSFHRLWMVRDWMGLLWLRVDSKIFKLLRNVFRSIDFDVCWREWSSLDLIVRHRLRSRRWSRGHTNVLFVFFACNPLCRCTLTSGSENRWVVFQHLKCVLVEHIVVLLFGNSFLVQQVLTQWIGFSNCQQIRLLTSSKESTHSYRPILASRDRYRVSPFKHVLFMPIKFGELCVICPWPRLTI